jgi:hypothetical protein
VANPVNGNPSQNRLHNGDSRRDERDSPSGNADSTANGVLWDGSIIRPLPYSIRLISIPSATAFISEVKALHSLNGRQSLCNAVEHIGRFSA